MAYNSSQNTLRILKKEYAERTRRTIFFLGAGTSAEAGLPTWRQLRDGLHDKIDILVDQDSDKEELENFHELEELRDKNDYWGYFDQAEEFWLTTYKDYLDEVFGPEIENIETPVIYKKIWEMRGARQVLTLNVDGLLSRAFSESTRTKQNTLIPYDGYSVVDSQAFFSRDSFCLLNLHGTMFQKSRWIMNESERRLLIDGKSGEKYKAFLTWLFQSHNIVFVGLNPRDIAISRAIQFASETGILGKHFWICPSPNAETRKWSEKNGVRLIAYSPETNANGIEVHSSDICSVLDDLDRYVSEDAPINLPKTCDEIDPRELGKPDELVTLLQADRNQAIRKMSGAATYVGTERGFSSPQLDALVIDNILPIQLATTLDSDTRPYNELLRYKLVKKIQSSGASTVWLCEINDRPGEYFVAKVLSGQCHEDAIERHSFRRGIESMYLLKDLDKKVAPSYIEHLELPLVVFMENIAGTTLRDIIDNNEIVNENDLLRLFDLICKSIRACHQSEGQVLHRDLKPGNIIFKDWYVGYDVADLLKSEIRLINFDLSWHRFTSGNTKSISAGEAGYYAPEQKASMNTAPPRTAATDVYMLGMILFYLLASENPPEGGARLTDWEVVVSTFVNRRFQQPLLQNRVQRLILSMTEKNIEHRPDIEAVLAEISSLVEFQNGRYSYVDHDFLVENILASLMRNYIWDAGKLEGRLTTVPQAHFVVRYQPKGMKCEIDFSRSRDDGATRSSFGSKINTRIKNVRQALSDSGWDCDIEGGVIKSLRAQISIAIILEKPDLGTKDMANLAYHLLSSIE